MAAAAALGAAVAAVACGPGFQAVYEGNARFEHCYGLEETPQSTMREKADCWRDWSDHYTYGQTRDRIQYAIARYVALSQAPNVPTDEALMMAAPGVTPRVSTITAPAPSNAFAPPPKVLETDGGPAALGVAPAATAAGRTAPLPTAQVPERATAPEKVAPAPDALSKGAALPGATCSEGCTSTFTSCAETCGTGDAGAHAKDCRACEVHYKKCMRGCYK